MDRTKQEIQSLVTRHEILHNYLLQKNTWLHSNTRKLNTKSESTCFNCVHKHNQLYSHLDLVTNIYNLNPKPNTCGKHCKGSDHYAPSIYMKETLGSDQKKNGNLMIKVRGCNKTKTRSQEVIEGDGGGC